MKYGLFLKDLIQRKKQYGGWETSGLQKTLQKTMASSHHME